MTSSALTPDLADVGAQDIEPNIARCRILLSLLALLAVYVDPTYPSLTGWLPLTGGPFTIDPYTLGVMSAHLVYSLATFWIVAGRFVDPTRMAVINTWGDVGFGAAILLVTEGTTSPFYAFFVFAVLTTGFRAGLRPTLIVTAVSVALYLSLILVSADTSPNVFIMRPAYLAITGYLVGYLGQQRLDLEIRLRRMEAAAQRQHIARALHDGYVQALAGVNLRLGTCRELMRRGRASDAFTEITDLQHSVNREHDELRAYIRSLADRDIEPLEPHVDDTHFDIKTEFSGSHLLVEHALQIIIEGVRNVSRHARARQASVSAVTVGGSVRIAVDDDGVGFADTTQRPWSIASRVTECDGRFEVLAGAATGAHLRIELPGARP